jgi:DNA-binding transcriptional regulator YiaG
MTGDEFKAARERLGHTQQEMAVALRMGQWGWQALSGWETGKRPVPGPVSLAVEYLLLQAASDAPQTAR